MSNTHRFFKKASVLSLCFLLSVSTLNTTPESRSWISEDLSLSIQLVGDEYQGTYTEGAVTVKGELRETEDGLKLGQYTLFNEEGNAFSTAEELLDSTGQIQVYDAKEKIEGKTKGWVMGDEKLTLTVTDSGETYAYYENDDVSFEGFVDENDLEALGITPSDTDDILSSETIRIGDVKLEKPARFSYGVSAGYVNTRWLVDWGDKGVFHDTAPGGYLSLDFGIRLDQKARFSFNLSYMTSLTGYMEKREGDEEYTDIQELGSTNAGFIGFSYNLKAKEGLPKGVIFSLGATLSNTTLMGENLTSLGPTGKLEAYVGIPGKGRYDYLISIGGMVTPNIGSDLFDQGNNDSLSVMYSFGLGFKISPKGIGGR